jgi:hypothetical protein
MTTKNTKNTKTTKQKTTPKIIQIIPCDIYPGEVHVPCLALRDDGAVIAMVFDFSLERLRPYNCHKDPY